MPNAAARRLPLGPLEQASFPGLRADALLPAGAGHRVRDGAARTRVAAGEQFVKAAA